MLFIFDWQDGNFSTALELAVRFGKTLIIQEMDGVEPVLFPLLRGDLTAMGMLGLLSASLLTGVFYERPDDWCIWVRFYKNVVDFIRMW